MFPLKDVHELDKLSRRGNLESISPTFYEQLFGQFPLNNKLQTQNVSTVGPRNSRPFYLLIRFFAVAKSLLKFSICRLLGIAPLLMRIF